MVAKFALAVAIFYIALTYLFGFASLQAFGLGLAFALAIHIAASRKTPEQAKFTPHRLIIQFHVGPSLLDLGLLRNDAEWKALVH